MKANGEDLIFVNVTLRDSRGHWVPAPDRQLRFAVRGPATLAAIGNADLTSFETYASNPHRTFNGRALVVLRSTHDSGGVLLTVSADGLPDARLSVQSLPKATSTKG